MTLSCISCRSSVLPSGRIQLQIDDAQHDPSEEKLSVAEIANLLKTTTRSVRRLSTRKRNALPLIRGKGRPYGLRSQINEWIADYRFSTRQDRVILARRLYSA